MEGCMCVCARLRIIMNRKIKGKRWGRLGRSSSPAGILPFQAEENKGRRGKTPQKYLIHQRIPGILINSALSRRFPTAGPIIIYFPLCLYNFSNCSKDLSSTFADDVLFSLWPVFNKSSKCPHFASEMLIVVLTMQHELTHRNDREKGDKGNAESEQKEDIQPVCSEGAQNDGWRASLIMEGWRAWRMEEVFDVGKKGESDEEMRERSGCWERDPEVNLLQLLELMDSVRPPSGSCLCRNTSNLYPHHTSGGSWLDISSCFLQRAHIYEQGEDFPCHFLSGCC